MFVCFYCIYSRFQYYIIKRIFQRLYVPRRTLPYYTRSLYVVHISSDVPRGLRSSTCRIRKKKILFFTNAFLYVFRGIDFRPYLMRHGRRANRKISTYVFISPRCFVRVSSPIRDTIIVNKSTEPCVFRLRAHCTRLVANYALTIIIPSIVVTVGLYDRQRDRLRTTLKCINFRYQ